MRLKQTAVCFLIAVHAWAWSSASFAVDDASDTRAAPPDAAKHAAIVQTVREAFQLLYQKKNTDGGQALIAKLLESETTLEGDPDTRYVMLSEARDLATEAGEFETVLKIIDTLTSNYRIDGDALKADALIAMVRTIKPESLELYTETANDLAAAALAKEDIKQGIRLVAQAESGIRRVRDAVTVARLREEVRSTKEMLTLVRRIDTMRTRLLQDADNAEAIATVGLYDYLVKKDRERGLAVLARSKEVDLKKIADLEQKTRREPTEWHELGDAWLSLAKRERIAVFREPMAKRAIYWYEQAVTEVSPVRQTIIRNRIGEAYKAAGLPAGYEKLNDQECERLVRFRDKWFLVIKEAKTWPDAAKWCADREGTLVTIKGSAENSFVWRLVKQTYPGQRNLELWLGASDSTKEGVWRWQDGSLLTYRKWAKREPNNTGGVEHYAIIWHYADGSWNDVPGHYKRHFIAEWKLK